MRGVVDDKNTAHHGLPAVRGSRTRDAQPQADVEACLPCTEYKTTTQLISLRLLLTRLWSGGVGIAASND